MIETGYMSTFLNKFRGQRCLFVQKIKKKLFRIEVYKDTTILAYYEGNSPEEVWKSTGILRKYGGTLFGLDHPQILDAIQKVGHVESCNYNDWNNASIMDKLFEKYLKRKLQLLALNGKKYL